MKESTLIAGFERVVAQHPDRVAVDALDRSIRYAELDRYANAVASTLAAKFGDVAEPVPLLMEQGVPLMAAMLGAMKARKSFSPLDSVYPPERLAQVLEDLDARVVLTDSTHRALAAAAVERIAGRKPLILDVGPLESDGRDTAGCPHPEPSDLAWVTFTSGSTGRPKGVTQNHANASCMTRAYIELAAITAEDRLTLLHPALTWDIFGALLSGATLCPYDLRVHGFSGVGAWLRQRGITLYRSFPTSYRKVMATLADDGLPSVRLVHLSGETVSRGDVELFRRWLPRGSTLLVLLGGGEAGIVSVERIDHDSEVGDAVPVGRPIEGVEVELIDENAAKVGAREIGEICVRSSQVFTGYWKQPQLTEAALVHLDRGSARPFLRTGDLGRLDETGRIFFCGRRDSQVKIRGYRIELGDVEAALQSFPGVQHAAVRTIDAPDGDKRLIGYFVSASGDVTEAGLLRHVRERLPVAMIPYRLLRLDSLPTTANGKIDRKALPDPPARAQADSPEQPADELEMTVANIWRQVLDVEHIERDDNFFDLGGHSLLAARVVSRIEAEIGRDFPIAGLFEEPTLRGMAALIREGQRGRPFPLSVAGKMRRNETV